MRSAFSLLGTIKCSTCNADVDIAELGDHVCAPEKQEPEPLKALPFRNPFSKPNSHQQDSSRQAKPTLPPIDPQAANRPFLGPREEVAPDSSSSGSQVSPATPADGQPFRAPIQNSRADHVRNGSNSSRKQSVGGYSSSPPNEQHLHAPPPNAALYAPVSPTVSGGKNLMARMNTIAPGPFGVSANHDRTPSMARSINNDRAPVQTRSADNRQEEYRDYARRPSRESVEKVKVREEAERKLNGGKLDWGRENDSSRERRPPTSGSDRRPPTSGSDRRPPTSGSDRRPPTSGSDRRPLTSGSERSTSSKRSQSTDSSRSRRKEQELPPLPTENVYKPKESNLPPPPVEINKPPVSPSYQAYRPAQPPQRLPPSPRVSDFKYRGPAPRGPGRPPVGLPSHPSQGKPQGLVPGPGPHSRHASTASNASTNLKPLPQQPPYSPDGRSPSDRRQIPRSDDEFPEDVRAGRSGPPQRGQDRLVPDARDRSRSRPRGAEEAREADRLIPKPSRNDHSMGNPYHAPSPSSVSNSSSTLSDRSGRSVSSGSSGATSDISVQMTGSHERKKSSIDLGEIDGLMKDLQASMVDLAQPSPIQEEHGREAISAARNQYSKSPLQRSESPPRKAAPAKSNCRGCGEAIQGKGLTSSDGRLTGRYHKHCFVCQTCREPFSSSTFYVWDNLPYCGRHYHELNNSICNRCNDGIEGPCLETERSDRFHPECFTCVECRTVLGEDYFELNGRPYCERHAYKKMQNSRLGPGRNMERRKTRMMMM